MKNTLRNIGKSLGLVALLGASALIGDGCASYKDSVTCQPPTDQKMRDIFLYDRIELESSLSTLVKPNKDIPFSIWKEIFKCMGSGRISEEERKLVDKYNSLSEQERNAIWDEHLTLNEKVGMCTIEEWRKHIIKAVIEYSSRQGYY